MGVTIKDIAQELNLSVSTVSYALNNGPRTISPDVRKKVLATAERLGYRPNRLAKSMVTGKTGTIAIIPPNKFHNIVKNDYFQAVLNGIVNEAEALNTDLLIITSSELENHRALGNLLLDGRSDAAIFIAPKHDDQITSALKLANFPFVFVSALSSELVPCFTVDNSGGVLQAIQHLVELGHRKIGHLAGSPDVPDARIRFEAFRVHCHALGIQDCPAEFGHFTIESGFTAGRILLNRENRPTAILAGNDEMAIGCINAAKELSIDVPHQLSVVGFDDIFSASHVQPPLTSIRQPVEELGELALRAVMALIAGKRTDSVTLPTQLIHRGSTAHSPEIAAG